MSRPDLDIKHMAAVLGAVVGSIFGPIDGPMYALIVFMITDYITGIISACMEKRLSSEEGAKGIVKKLGIFVIVGMANILDVYIIKEGGIIRLMTIFFYLANEGISILENAGAIGIPIPAKIKEVLIQLREKSNEGTLAERDEET